MYPLISTFFFDCLCVARQQVVIVKCPRSPLMSAYSLRQLVPCPISLVLSSGNLQTDVNGSRPSMKKSKHKKREIRFTITCLRCTQEKVHGKDNQVRWNGGWIYTETLASSGFTTDCHLLIFIKWNLIECHFFFKINPLAYQTSVIAERNVMSIDP